MLKKLLFSTTYILLLTTCTLQAQDWQWIQRGGGYTTMSNGYTREGIVDIVVDSDNNSYTMSPIGGLQPDVAGNPLTFYGYSNNIPDYVLTSFSFDGTYRWSKVFGGGGNETIEGVEIDANDNVYVAGHFKTCVVNNYYAPHIDEDYIIDQTVTPIDCRNTFITKFDKDGNFQWVQRPLSSSANSNDMRSMDLKTTADGTSYWLVTIDAPGTYADSFTYTGTDREVFILKYDTNGNFIEAIPLNIDVSDGGLQANMQLYINPNNNYIYLTAHKSSSTSETFSIQGQTLTGSSYIACLDATGTLQWMLQDAQPDLFYLAIKKLAFDSQNDMYIACSLAGFGLNTFLGLTINENQVPHVIFKVDATTATTVHWYTYPDTFSTNNLYDLVYDDVNNKVVFTGRVQGDSNYTWGNQTIYPSTNNGSRPMMATFDPANGDCTGLYFINGGPGALGNGRALAVDHSGDYLVGGDFNSYLNDANGNAITSIGGDTDFFLTKFSTQACTPLSTQNNQAINLQPYPNPTYNNINVPVTQQTSYTLYNIQGALLQQGTLNTNNQSVPLNNYPTGMYLLTLTTNGQSQTHKIIKQ
ncbi:T9SS type A sorting domain-containing protein [Neptunitalea lumnitzerae]|uniref:Secretion system C-terminal sorting domain-containing protein n=1 Tax=Neptunitalea lumnitzerae TaxID=2965509 RepID=A0ABQ5MN52_9FLAO|nr:T9SS type A sorting domain-containing protein [Neptunitalea sp. Y10]GLB50809.1 hypothetical protein Y10_31770 [Neptunitalea sp. Y10]